MSHKIRGMTSSALRVQEDSQQGQARFLALIETLQGQVEDYKRENKKNVAKLMEQNARMQCQVEEGQ